MYKLYILLKTNIKYEYIEMDIYMMMGILDICNILYI